MNPDDPVPAGADVPAAAAVSTGAAGSTGAAVRRRGAVLLVLTGGLVTLVAQARTWATGQAHDVVGAAPLSVPGTLASPGVRALALVTLAGAVVMATGRRGVARVAAALLAIAGAVSAGLAAAFLADPARALRARAAELTGTTGEVSGVSVTAWGAVALAAGIAVIIGSGWALVRSGAWAAPSSRYERGGGPAPAPGGRGPAGREPLWDSLSRGEDPTG